MTVFTAAELSNYRTRPHRSNLKLVIYRPAVILAAEVGIVATEDHATLIPFTNVTSGSYANIRPGMTMYVGTAPGKADLGRVRIKDYATSVYVEVARNSMRWSLNPYLTVVDFYEIWPKYIQEIQSGTSTEHYKDWDIGYSDQNAVMGTLLNVGSHAVCEAGNQVYWGSTGTVQTQGSALSYTWIFGGTTGGSTLDEPGWVTYPTPGNYTTRVEALVTGTSHTDYTYRHVVVLGGDVQPYTKFEFESLDGTRDEGGWHGKFTVHETNDDEVIDGSLVMLYSQTTYGNTEANYGHAEHHRENMLFVGYIIDNSVTYDYRTSSIEFEVASSTGRMKLTDSSSMEIDSVLTSVNWYQIPYLNGKRALYHYLNWHTTVLNCCDVQWSLTDKPLRYVQGEISSIYDLVYKMMSKYLLGEVVADRIGTIWIENHPMSIHDQGSQYETTCEITRQDWKGEVVFDEILTAPINYLEAGGLVYGGITGSIVNDIALTGSYTTVLSGAPGNNLREYFGKPDLIQGYYIGSQDENNVLVGDIFAYKASKYPSVNCALSGWYAGFDISPQQITLLTLNQSDTQRGIVWASKKFLLREMSIDHPNNASLFPELNLHECTEGITGETVPVLAPPIVNTPGFTPGGFVLPPFNPGWPQIPIPSFIPRIPPIVSPPISECIGENPANGPYDTFIRGTYTDEGGSDGWEATADFPCILRAASVANRSTYSLRGIFYKKSGTSWVETTDDDFYDVIAQPPPGSGFSEIIAYKDAVTGDGHLRTGYFDAPVGFECARIILRIYSSDTSFNADYCVTYASWHSDFVNGGSETWSNEFAANESGVFHASATLTFSGTAQSGGWGGLITRLDNVGPLHFRVSVALSGGHTGSTWYLGNQYSWYPLAHYANYYSGSGDPENRATIDIDWQPGGISADYALYAHFLANFPDTSGVAYFEYFISAPASSRIDVQSLYISNICPVP